MVVTTGATGVAFTTCMPRQADGLCGIVLRHGKRWLLIVTNLELQ